MLHPHSSRSRPRIEFSIKFEPYHLSKEEDDERTKRLSRKILDCITEKRGARRRGRPREKPEVKVEEFFGSEIEKLLE